MCVASGCACPPAAARHALLLAGTFRDAAFHSSRGAPRGTSSPLRVLLTLHCIRSSDFPGQLRWLTPQPRLCVCAGCIAARLECPCRWGQLWPVTFRRPCRGCACAWVVGLPGLLPSAPLLPATTPPWTMMPVAQALVTMVLATTAAPAAGRQPQVGLPELLGVTLSVPRGAWVASSTCNCDCTREQATLRTRTRMV